MTIEDKKFDTEVLRPVEFVFEPDPRSDSFGTTELGDHYGAISAIVLRNEVPKDVRVSFETVKNLYLYSWFVYRFFPIAEHQALVCLELSLRERFAAELPKRYSRKGRELKPTLRELLSYAAEAGHIRNEGFRRWHERALNKARQRYDMEMLKEMIEKNLEEQELDYSRAVVTDEDRDWGYLESLIGLLPERRNSYAHGSRSLSNQVRGTIELVAEMVNQLYAHWVAKEQ